MDFLHDSVALPGSSSQPRRFNDAASHSGLSQLDSSLPKSLLRFLREPSSLIGTFSGNAASSKEAAEQARPDPTNEWQKQLLRLKLRQVSESRLRSCLVILRNVFADALG